MLHLIWQHQSQIFVFLWLHFITTLGLVKCLRLLFHRLLNTWRSCSTAWRSWNSVKRMNRTRRLHWTWAARTARKWNCPVPVTVMVRSVCGSYHCSVVVSLFSSLSPLFHRGVNPNLFWGSERTRAEGPERGAEAQASNGRSVRVRWDMAPEKFWNFTWKSVHFGAFWRQFCRPTVSGENFWRDEKILSPQYFDWVGGDRTLAPTGIDATHISQCTLCFFAFFSLLKFICILVSIL